MPASKQKPDTPPPAMPTPEEQAKMQAVAVAGAEAAQEAPPGQASDQARAAMKAESERQEMPLTEEQLDQLANLFVDKTISKFEERGAFDPPPEPVAPAVPTEAPPAPGQEEAAAAAPAEPEPAPAPQRTTWAQRFMGVR